MVASCNAYALHYWPFVRGLHRWPLEFPHKGTVMRALVFLWSQPEKGCGLSNRVVGGLRHDGAWATSLQWASHFCPFNTLKIIMRQHTRAFLVQIMTCCLFGAKSLSETSGPHCQMNPDRQTVNFDSNCNSFHLRKGIQKCRLQMTTILS